jgi:uncharacterized iron-regulated protein
VSGASAPAGWPRAVRRRATVHLAAAAALALCACAGARPSPGAALHADHPLVGRTWAVRDAAWVEPSARDAALARADLVLLGETHDNPEHHRLQAAILRALVAAGRRPAVAFEMLDTGQQPKVDAALRESPGDPDALAAAVGWDESGWPEFSMYRPVFAAALDAGLPIVAANLSRQQARKIFEGAKDVISPRARQLLDNHPPLTQAEQASLREEMAASHCGELPASMLDPMVEMQRARDAQLAERLLAAADARGAVLIAGAGHVRDDRGVPSYLRQEAPAPSLRTVGFVEVQAGRDDPAAYAAEFGVERLPFDYVVFTPRTDRGDPCEGLRHHKPTPPAPAGSTWVRR